MTGDKDQGNEAVFTNLADVDFNPKILRAAESGYRRGYTQGVAATLDGLENGRTYAELCHWLDEDLMPWRWRQLKPDPWIPPAPKRKAQQ